MKVQQYNQSARSHKNEKVGVTLHCIDHTTRQSLNPPHDPTASPSEPLTLNSELTIKLLIQLDSLHALFAAQNFHSADTGVFSSVSEAARNLQNAVLVRELDLRRSQLFNTISVIEV